MIVDVRPEGHPYAPTHVSESLTVGRPAGLSIASAGGVRGGASDGTLPSTSGFLFMLSKAPSACTLMPLPHAIESLSARVFSCTRASLPEASSPADFAMI